MVEVNVDVTAFREWVDETLGLRVIDDVEPAEIVSTSVAKYGEALRAISSGNPKRQPLTQLADRQTKRVVSTDRTTTSGPVTYQLQRTSARNRG